MALTPLPSLNPTDPDLGEMIAPAPKLTLVPRSAPGLTPLPPVPPPTMDLSGISNPAPVLPPVLKPLVQNGSFRGQQEQMYQNDIQRLMPKPEEPGFWHKLGHIASRIGNIAGDIAAPGVMMNIPGTDFNNRVRMAGDTRALAGLQGQNQAEQNDFSRRTLEGAEAANVGQEAALAPGKAASDEALQSAQTEHLQNPMATTPEMGTYQALTKMGMSPSQALREIERDKQMALKPPNMQAKTLQLPNGQQVAGKTDAQGNLLLENGQPAPAGTKLYQQPNYGQMVLPTKTATFIGPDGIPREYQWNEQTQTYDKPLGLSASNAYGHEAAQAGAVSRAGDDLIRAIEANKNLVGNPEAIIKSALLGTPWADPATAGLRAQIATFAALQPSMHGFRGNDALQQFEKIIGGIPNNPDALIAAIQGIEKTAGAINPGLNGGNAGPKPGDVENGYRFKGGDPSDQKNWEKVK